MCDSVVAVGSETSDGATLFAKNSDRKPLECQPFVQHAAAHHPPRARVRCTHIEIPEVAETYRLMGHSPAWVWGFEHGVNEHGVAIGNHTIFSKEPIEEEPGLIGMDLVRLGLERGRDAREALEVIATLIETHGMGGPALAPDGAGYHNSFALADPTSAWVLEASNRRWAARRVSRTACSNHMAIGSDWEIASRDLENHARCEGWWREDTRVDVSAAYRNHHIPEHICAHSAPVHVTTASLVAALPAERPGPWPVWVSFGTPCSSVFLPVYLDGVIPAALARDGHPGDGAWSHFKHLQDAVAEDPVPRTRRVREGFAGLEAEIEAERVAVERSARTAAVARDLDYAADIVTRFMERSVESALVRADELAASLARD
jgi:dipeptidase